MTSVIRIVYSNDGSDIKDDVIRRIKEGQEEPDHIETCSLSDRLARGSDRDNHTDVNILILTPSLCSEINKHADHDFKVLFPNLEKSLLLVCDTESEQMVRSVISKSVEYSKIRQFQISNTMEWKYMMVPTIKQMTSPEEEEPSIPDINRYVIKPKRVDSVKHKGVPMRFWYLSHIHTILLLMRHVDRISIELPILYCKGSQEEPSKL